MNIVEAAARDVYGAVSRGDVAGFQQLVNEDPYLVDGASFPCSRNLLHIATMCGRAVIVEEVLKICPRLARSLDSQNQSPLHIAAAEGHLEITQNLLRVAPEMCWSRDCQGMNPVHIAAMKGHLKILKRFLHLDYSPAMERVHRGQTVLHLCVKHGQLSTLEYLMEKMGGEFVCARDDDGDSIFHWAAKNNNFEASIVEAVLNISPRLARSLDSQNRSPLHIAAAEGNLEIAKKLLSGAPEMRWSRDSQGMNPIHIAASNGNVEILEQLLALGCFPAMERVHRGQTVLHLCVKHNQLSALEFLVKELETEFLYAKDDDGDTIFHWAVRTNQIVMIQYLARYGRDYWLERNSMGKTPMEIISQSSEIKGMLKSKEVTILEKLFPGTSQMNVIIIGVVVVIATMAFQAIISPPGGFWQEDSDTHKAGEAVMAYTHPKMYKVFNVANSTAFIFSFFTIILLTTRILSSKNSLILSMWASIVSIVMCYETSSMMIIPDDPTPNDVYLMTGFVVILPFIIIAFQEVPDILIRKYEIVIRGDGGVLQILRRRSISQRQQGDIIV